jgi:hypothetical protein
MRGLGPLEARQGAVEEGEAGDQDADAAQEDQQLRQRLADVIDEGPGRVIDE